MGNERGYESVLSDIRLDPPTTGDIEPLHEIYRDPRVWTLLPSGRHTDLATTTAMVTSWIDAWERDGLATWVVRDVVSREALGHVGCSVRNETFWNLGYRLAANAQGRGIASRVSKVAVKRAQLIAPELPVIAYLLEHNHASARVAEKCGLTLRHRAPDAGNPDPSAIRLVYADRELSDDELRAALA